MSAGFQPESTRNPARHCTGHSTGIRALPDRIPWLSERIPGHAHEGARARAGSGAWAAVQFTAVHGSAVHGSSPRVVTKPKIGTKVTREPATILRLEITTMATPAELERLAGSAAKLRPDWSARSVRTYLEARHADRAYADLAVALAMICCDPATETPARLEQHGPWWVATRANMTGFGGPSVPAVGPGGRPPCPRPGHEHEAAATCRLCRAEALTDTPPDPPAPAVKPPTGWRPAIVRNPTQETA